MQRRPDNARPSAPRSRLQFECILASVWLAVGLFLLPAAIYWVGIFVLGPYGEGTGLGAFYADFFGDLASFAAPAWIVALGPLVLISLVRLAFLNWRRTPDDTEQEDEDPPSYRADPPEPRHAARPRVEPRIGQDPL